jgi:hypothetical protein
MKKKGPNPMKDLAVMEGEMQQFYLIKNISAYFNPIFKPTMTSPMS